MNSKMSESKFPAQKKWGRRKFLQTTGIAAFGALSGKTLAQSFTGISADRGKIVLQLYTVRNEFNKNIPETLKKIRAIGFDTVETAFWPEHVTVKQAGQWLKEAGLTVCSAHVEIPVGDKKAAMLEVAETFHCKRMIWHGWPEDKRYSSLDGTKELINIYNEANHFAKSNGLMFGLHNHWWEYRNKVDGRFVYQVLLEGVEPDIFFEIDTYWVKVAGHDPAKIVGEFGKRAPLLHIKDGPAIWSDSLPADNPDPMVAVGKGTQNFPAIVQSAAGNTAFMVVEMDRVATDVYDAIRDSYTYLTQQGLAKA